MSGGVGGGKAAGEGKAAGGGAAPKIDIEELARKVYGLMQAEARLSSHRLGSPLKPGRNGHL